MPSHSLLTLVFWSLLVMKGPPTAPPPPPPDIETALSQLTHQEAEVRRKGLQVLGSLDDPRLPPVLATLLGDQDVKIRRGALWALWGKQYAPRSPRSSKR